jgi:hypothetical protein
MTNDDKALVEQLEALAVNSEGQDDWLVMSDAAARIQAQAAEIERLREALKEVFEAWAGSEGFIPETAPEGYLLYLTKRMAHIARAALGETK